MNEGSLRGRLRGNIGVLVLCSTIVLLSILMSADPEVARIFGWKVPPLCVFVNVLGMECLVASKILAPSQNATTLFQTIEFFGSEPTSW